MKTVAIIGAGPAGLTAAYELLRQSNEYQVTIFEKDSCVGGLSKTFEFEGGRIDIGGHRFYTRSEAVLNLWEYILPRSDQGMLTCNRSSHILWKRKLIDYPIKLNIQTMHALGLREGTKVLISYLKSKLEYKRKNADNLEEFYVKRFGKELYSIFFRDYTYKLWGIAANKISSDWGMQRIQNISLGELFRFVLKDKRQSKEKSLISQYQYPAFGAGQIWNELANRIVELGGKIETDCSVEHMVMRNSQISSVKYRKRNQLLKKDFDYVLSSMPLSELISAIDKTPLEIKKIGSKLHYRDMVIIGICLPIEAMGPIFLKSQNDNWLYMQDITLSFGRIQILNNWSPYAIYTNNHVLLELEYFCDKDDKLWRKKDELLIEESLTELIQCGFCTSDAKADSYIVKRIEKAYPVYNDGYYQMDVVQDWIDGIDNLRCIGRNGQHRYNNMDHSVETGIEAVKSILNNSYNRKLVWNVNTDKEYLEK